MENAKARRRPDGIAGMFVPAATAMIFSTVAGFLASAIDGIITSRFLGRDAYSAVSLFSPMVNMLLLFASSIAVGGQVLGSRLIGAGEKEQARAQGSPADGPVHGRDGGEHRPARKAQEPPGRVRGLPALRQERKDLPEPAGLLRSL